MSPVEKSVELSWESFLLHIKEWVSPKIFDTWFSSLSLIGIQSGKVLISVPNKFFKDWLEEHYGELIKKTIEKTFGQKAQVNLIIPDKEKKKPSPDPYPSPEKHSTHNSFLDPKNTFQSFVVGSCNQFAHAASLAVAQSPANAYNPLFIYGGVGLGKTHLLHAIVNYITITEKKKNLRLSYLPSEKFVNELISSLQHDQMTNFRNKYRNIDVLLIDDIQFIGGKERTQEEFFHTFNTLYESNKQIVFSCDRTPKEIPTLEERLQSRFEWGLIADIQPPDLETKVAILNKKAEEKKIYLPEEIALYIATNIKSNVRELEGALVRLSAYASLTNTKLSMELAQEVLKEIFYIKDRATNIENIQKLVSRYFGITVAELRSSKRNKTISLPRQIAMYLCREMTKLSLPEIGRQFGGKDHTTVLHSVNKIKSLMNKDREINTAIKTITKTVKG
ncbi:MAG: chromosomal replication initiation protein DnaA [Nitrospinae bacterium RIFCSPLOWO2_12_FULL_45_22]|nr:MAG: chromosomal replication initiation protein DnaA [Nitrospinae bacterium RIFCSPLOWO2_12_FULL_45_22]